MKERKIIHLDMDSYFASIEQRDVSIYRGKPLVVCHTDDPSSNRGVVSSASYPARAYGLKAGMSVLEAKKLCPKGIYIRGNYDKYLYNTKKIIKICRRYSDLVEVFSIDEVFVDITPTGHFFGSPANAGKEIQKIIGKRLGLSVTIGIGPNKLVAKMATEFKKPSGFTVIEKKDLPHILAPLPVGKIVGVGKRTKSYLNSLGVETIGDLSGIPVKVLERKYGVVGLFLHQASLGIDSSPVIPNENILNIKSFGHSSSLGNGCRNLSELKAVLLTLCEGVTRRMRKDGYRGRTVSLRLCFDRLFSISRSYSMKELSDLTNRIYLIAVQLLEQEKQLFNKYSATLIGVSVTNLVNDKLEGRQISIFDLLNKREFDLTKAVDLIKNKYGESIIVRGSVLDRQKRFYGVPRIELLSSGKN
jgi:DNA polymerase-4